jgi:hypothetical protein
MLRQRERERETLYSRGVMNETTSYIYLKIKKLFNFKKKSSRTFNTYNCMRLINELLCIRNRIEEESGFLYHFFKLK